MDPGGSETPGNTETPASEKDWSSFGAAVAILFLAIFDQKKGKSGILAPERIGSENGLHQSISRGQKPSVNSLICRKSRYFKKSFF